MAAAGLFVLPHGVAASGQLIFSGTKTAVTWAISWPTCPAAAPSACPATSLETFPLSSFHAPVRCTQHAAGPTEWLRGLSADYAEGASMPT